MKKFYATEDSAIQLIRLGLFPRDYTPYAFAPSDILDAACRARDIKSLAAASDTIAMLSTPYTVLIPEHTQRRASKLVTSRTLSAEIKEPYLVGIDDDCLCVIPELLFALYCQRHDLASSVQLGLSSAAPTPALPSRITCASPHTTLASLPMLPRSAVSFPATAGIYGARRAARYARYVQDCSASPMETNLFLLLCLPTSEGGYGLPLPELNADLPIIQYLGSKHVPGIRYGDLVFAIGACRFGVSKHRTP